MPSSFIVKITSKSSIYLDETSIVESLEYGETKPELDDFIEIAQNIDSNFFTMDVAKKKDGDWIIMELGDGQVAGLPDNADRKEFYNNLKENALQQ
ncbi:MAG: hypothetical protein CMB97_08255 [Flavobacteriaceae bacterium]|nr:hypothetical protein [Flavobacteriaceae bacterium]